MTKASGPHPYTKGLIELFVEVDRDWFGIESHNALRSRYRTSSFEAMGGYN